MKKFLFLLILASVHLSTFSQTEKRNVVKAKKAAVVKAEKIKVDKHEVKFGLIKPVTFQTIEISYEYIPFNKLGFGTTVLFNTNKSNRSEEDFSITPFARFYFQDPKLQNGNGLFLEGYGKYVSGRYRILDDIDLKYNSAAVGLGFGYKWIFKSGLIIEPFTGFSQVLSRSNSAAPVGNFRGEIFLGYRF